MVKLKPPTPGASVKVAAPPKPVSGASFTLEGKHAGMPLPKVGDNVAVHTIGKVRSVSMDHYSADSSPSARFSVDANDVNHEPFAAKRSTLSDLIMRRQARKVA